MMVVDMKLMPPKVIRKKLVYELEIFLGYQKILHSKGAQTFERVKTKK